MGKQPEPILGLIVSAEFFKLQVRRLAKQQRLILSLRPRTRQASNLLICCHRS